MSLTLPTKKFFNHELYLNQISGIVANLFLSKKTLDNKLYTNRYSIFWKGREILKPFQEIPRQMAFFSPNEILQVQHESLKFIADAGVLIYLHSLATYLVFDKLNSLVRNLFLLFEKQEYFQNNEHYTVVKIPILNIFENITSLEIPLGVKGMEKIPGQGTITLYCPVDVLVTSVIQMIASEKAQYQMSNNSNNFEEISLLRLEAAYNFVKNKQDFYLVSVFLQNCEKNHINAWDIMENISIDLNNYSWDALTNWIFISIMEHFIDNNNKLFNVFEKDLNESWTKKSSSELFISFTLPYFSNKINFDLIQDFFFIFGETSGLYVNIAKQFTLESLGANLTLNLTNYAKQYFE